MDIFWNHTIGLLLATDVSETCEEAISRVKMASTQVAETSVANNSPSQDSSNPDDHFQSRNNNNHNNM